jgi:hypothetical protein
MASPDEPAQTVRAAAVVRGQLGGTETVVRQTDEHVMNIVRAEVTLPRGYGELDGARLCYGFFPHITANCATPISNDPAEGPASTYVGRYPPPYHALVGWPSLVLGTERAIWAMRLLSVVLAAAFIATAAMAARRVRGAALVLVGVLLAVTPGCCSCVVINERLESPPPSPRGPRCSPWSPRRPVERSAGPTPAHRAARGPERRAGSTAERPPRPSAGSTTQPIASPTERPTAEPDVRRDRS